MGDLFDPFGMGSGSGVGSSVGSSRQASGPDLFGDLLGSDSSATSGFSSAHSNPTPASNTSLFNLSKDISYSILNILCFAVHAIFLVSTNTNMDVPFLPLLNLSALMADGNMQKKLNLWMYVS